ncbi:MAG: archaeoflavoprotein AfpA [Candidatus Lokiarchaeota archaeon]|nr:archaeoflavoprotein AfpA [Candidatus Lokiarchaeota archaeon]MCK4778902.1 archaeoflavoprotein AfpA [Candidatus Lokiarchaeota archaeon]
MTFKLIFGMTGTGYVLEESIDLMKELQDNYDVDITVILSKEGAAVVKWYKKWLLLTETVKKVKVEKTPNIPFYAGPLQIGNYDLFLACPVSANSVAKIVCGIADTLITNCVAQAIKGGQTVYIFPSDQDTEPIVTSRPNGAPLVLKIRDIELENIKKLKQMEGITVIKKFEDIRILILNKINE